MDDIKNKNIYGHFQSKAIGLIHIGTNEGSLKDFQFLLSDIAEIDSVKAEVIALKLEVKIKDAIIDRAMMNGAAIK